MVDGKPIQDPQQLSIVLFSKRVGDVLHFTLRSPDGTPASVDVTVARRPSDPESILDPTNLSEDLVERLGIIAVPLSPDIAKLIPPARRPQGLVVVALTAGGQGAAMDLQVGDVLYALNGKPIASLETLRGYLDHLARNAGVALQLERDGKLQYLAFTNSDQGPRLTLARRAAARWGDQRRQPRAKGLHLTSLEVYSSFHYDP
jgi:serine protease Do